MIFFTDSIVSCDSSFYSWNITLLDTVIPISLDAIGTIPCESCKGGKNELTNDFPSILIPVKEVKFDRKIIGEHNGLHSFDSNDTIKVMCKGLFVLKSKKELVVIECTRRHQYDTGIMVVYILLKSGKVENWCINHRMQPNSWRD